MSDIVNFSVSRTGEKKDLEELQEIGKILFKEDKAIQKNHSKTFVHYFNEIQNKPLVFHVKTNKETESVDELKKYFRIINEHSKQILVEYEKDIDLISEKRIGAMKELLIIVRKYPVEFVKFFGIGSMSFGVFGFLSNVLFKKIIISPYLIFFVLLGGFFMFLMALIENKSK